MAAVAINNSKKVCYIANILTHHYIFNRYLINKMVDDGWEVCVISNIDDKKLRWNKKIKFVDWNVNRTSHAFLTELHSIRQLSWIIKKEQPDLVHNFTIKGNIYGSIAGRIFSKAKIVNTISGLGYIFTETSWITSVQRFLIKVFWLFSLNLATVTIFQNRDDEKLFKKLFLKTATVVIPGHGINLEIYKKIKGAQTKKILKEIGCKRNSIIITTTARLIKQKGIIEIFDAYRILKQRHPNLFFVIIGMLDEHNPTRISKTEIKSMENRHFVFLFNRTDVNEILSISSIFIMVSYREGLPLASVEALASGLPIITTDVPGCRERIKNNQNGLLVPAKNYLKLAKAIEKLILNPDLRKRMGRQSRKFAKNYDQKILTDIVMKQYNIKA